MRFWRVVLVDGGVVILAGGAALFLVGVSLGIAGYPALVILREWLVGAVGTKGDILVSLKNATPLIFTGLAAGIAFRSGVFNIGAEGQSIAGAIMAVAVATRFFPGWPAWAAIPAALVAAAMGGALWAGIAAGMQRFRDVPVVLSTILLNFVAVEMLSLVLEGPLKSHGTQVIQSDILPAGYQLPVIFPRMFLAAGGYLHAGFFIALLVAGVAWVMQARTSFGFEILVTGLNRVAAKYAGMPVATRQFAVMLIWGAFAGMANTVQMMGVEGAHFLSPSPASYGYAGIAVALLGRLHPVGIVLAAVFFAMLDRGAANLEFFGLPLEISDVVKAVLVLVVLAVTVRVARRGAA